MQFRREQIEVTASGVREFLTRLIAVARSHESGRAFVQLGPEDCAEGVDLFCDTRGGFLFCIRLDWVLTQREQIREIVFNPESVEHIGERWYAYFDRQSESIVEVLFRTLREICGCLEGAVFEVDWVDPETWETDHEGAGGATLHIPVSSEEREYICALCDQPIEVQGIDACYVGISRHDETGIEFDCHAACALKVLPRHLVGELLEDVDPGYDA